jgi:hypothetical protein
MNLIKLCTVYSVLLVVAAAQETTIRIQLSSEEIDDVTFDATRVSSVELSRWMQLSEGGRYTEADFGAGLCFSGPPTGTNKKQKAIDDARAAQSKLRERISDMDESHFPPELGDVVSYLRRQQSFWLWLDTQKLAFLETGDVGTLQSRFEDIVEPQKSCGEVVRRIRDAKSHKEAWHLACFDWHNCVLDAGDAKIGPYPKQAWQSFLAAYGIREQIGSTEED